MRFVSVRDLRGRPAQIWKQLARFKDMVLTLNGKPIAIISSTSEDQLEENLAEVRKARAMVALDAIRRESARRGLDKMTMEEIDALVQETRKARAK
ncbi:MAG TPA: type II toxin-antitoxin system Phd/YefM family antitoxin [Candidatus Omnitrophota bacterium]|nr:type II toxin-antitoxin system Phd/YefM family antitoxin [Candidatus Omnitrophota bacterium]